MGDFGETLRRAREASGRDVQDISQKTRIQPKYLEALETEDWRAVPAGVIGRGFVRMLAREFALDPADLLERYRAARGPEHEEPGHTLPASDLKLDLHHGRRRGPMLAGLATVAVLLLAVWAWKDASRRDGVPSDRPSATAPAAEPEASGGKARAPTPVPSPSPKAPPAPQASPTPPPAPASPPPEAAKTAAAPASAPVATPKPVPTPAPVSPAPAAEPAKPTGSAARARLEIQADERVWVRVVADGGPAKALFLGQGRRVAFEAAERLDLKLGNAGSVKLFWNGEALKAPGAPAEVVSLSLPRDLARLRP